MIEPKPESEARELASGAFATAIVLDAQAVDERLTEHFEKELRALWKAQEKPVKGFRRGHVPRRIIEQHFGGPLKAYEAVYADLLTQGFHHLTGRSSLVFMRLAVTRPDVGSVVLRAIVHPVPVVSFRDGFDLRAVVLEEPEGGDVEAHLDRVFEGVRHRAAVHQPVDESSSDATWVLASIEASVGGEPWKEGSSEHHMYGLEAGTLWPDALRQSMLGRKVGDRWEQDVTLCGRFGPLAGTVVHQVCTVHGVSRLQVPTLDDTFAALHGHESVAVWRESLRAPIAEQLGKARKAALCRQLVKQVEASARVDHASDDWVQVFVLSRLAELEAAFGTQERMFAAYGAASQDEMVAKLSEEGRASLRQELLVLALGEHVGRPVREHTAARMALHVPGILEAAIGIVTVRSRHDLGEPASPHTDHLDLHTDHPEVPEA
jgi:FKBP-type peptidyl-prolyl cis-trans isomerase (trigger factor)